MKTFLLLPLLAMLAFPDHIAQTPPADGSQITVISFKWSRTRQTMDNAAGENPLPAAAVTQADKNFDKNSRINDPAGVRDPKADTVDTRGAELEKNARAAQKAGTKTVDAFAYQAKIRNVSKQAVEIVFWEYQFADQANPTNVSRRQFICGVNIKPDKEKELQAFSLSGPTDSISATSTESSASPFQEKVIINRVEFSDGKSWTRKDWNANEIKTAYQRAMATPWSKDEMCRSLR